MEDAVGEPRQPITADDVDAVVACVVDELRPASHQDWMVPAGTLEWSCWITAEHIGQVLTHYSAQLAVQAPTWYVRWVSKSPDIAPPAGVLDFVEGAGRMCAMVVRGSAPEARAYHPRGVADPEGFAGGCCIEALVHGQDIASGLGIEFDPPRDICERIIARMFPHQVPPLADHDPWLALQWATGRIALPNLPRLDDWKWRASPLTEEWSMPPAEPRAFEVMTSPIRRDEPTP